MEVHCSKSADNSWLNMSQQVALVVMKSNCILSCVSKNIASRLRELIPPLCSALETSSRILSPVWGSPVQQQNIDTLKKDQSRASGMFRGVRHISYKKRLRELGLFRGGGSGETF